VSPRAQNPVYEPVRIHVLTQNKRFREVKSYCSANALRNIPPIRQRRTWLMVSSTRSSIQATNHC